MRDCRILMAHDSNIPIKMFDEVETHNIRSVQIVYISTKYKRTCVLFTGSLALIYRLFTVYQLVLLRLNGFLLKSSKPCEEPLICNLMSYSAIRSALAADALIFLCRYVSAVTGLKHNM